MLDKEPKEEHPLAHVNMARGCSSFYLHGFSLTISSEVITFFIILLQCSKKYYI